MKKILVGVFSILMLVLTSGPGRAETKTLSWDAVTTYTDGSPIAPGTVSYTMFWSASASLTSQHIVANGITGTTQTFDVNTQGMVRGSTVYFSGYASVGTNNSANAVSLAWIAPYKVPNAPTNLRLTLLMNADGIYTLTIEEADRV